MDAIRFCHVPPARLQLAAEQVCCWPDHDITWTITDGVSGIDDDAYLATFASVYHHIAQHCGILPRQTQLRTRPRIQSGVRRIDGGGGVLAESELPCGGTTVCRQWYDLGDRWSLVKQPGHIWLWMVALHEVLHALGIPHCENRGIVAVMNPTYNPNLTGLQPWDIQELRRRYGPPKALPTPVVPTPQPTGGFMGNLGVLLKLLTQLGPLIKFFTENQQAIGSLLDVLRKLAESFAKPSAVEAVTLGVSRDGFRDVLVRASSFFAGLAALTPTTVDDALARTFADAVSTDWLFDLLYQLVTGRAQLTEAAVAQALAEVKAA